MKVKKIIAVFTAVALLLLSGCGDPAENSSSAPPVTEQSAAGKDGELTLLYCADDTMNPYKTISKLNAELSSLLFEPLVKVDNSFNEVLVLAEKIEYSENICTVTLKDTVFSDGSALTAEDVIFSYGLAKGCSRFSYLFYEVEKAEAADSRTVVFTLSVKDPYFSKLLTFPVLKTGSDQLKNEDNVELVPIGSGKYIFSEDSAALVPNPNFRGDVGEVKRISLINAPDNESMQHYVEVGATDIYYAEMYDDTIIRMSGKKYAVNLNNLIYIGINHDYEPLKNASLRYAVSSAISRADIVNSSYYTDAVAATGFFHPAFAKVAGYQTIQSDADLKISVENLANIGYNKLNEDGFYENAAGKTVELSLLVNKDNATKLATANLIAGQLKNAGIRLTVNAVSEEAYYTALEEGNFQLYLGEIKLPNNMDVSSLLLEGGSAAYGIGSAESDEKSKAETESDKKNGAVSEGETGAGDGAEGSGQAESEPVFDDEYSYVSVIKGFYSGENTIVDVASSLLSSMPVIPLMYRSSILFYSDAIADPVSASACDIYLSSDKYILKK